MISCINNINFSSNRITNRKSSMDKYEDNSNNKVSGGGDFQYKFSHNMSQKNLDVLQEHCLDIPLEMVFSFDNVISYLDKQTDIDGFIADFNDSCTAVFGAIQRNYLDSQKQKKFEKEISFLRQALNLCVQYKRQELSKGQFDSQFNELSNKIIEHVQK